MTPVTYESIVNLIYMYLGCAKRALIACKKITKNSALDMYIKEVINLLDMYIKKMEKIFKETNKDSNMICDYESFDNLSIILALIIQELRKETEDYESMFNHDILVLKSPRFEVKIPLHIFVAPMTTISYIMSSDKNSFVITDSYINVISKKIRGERDPSAIRKAYQFGQNMVMANYYYDYDFELPNEVLDILETLTIEKIPDGYDAFAISAKTIEKKLTEFSNICDKFK